MNFLRLSWWCTPIIGFFWVRARDLSGQSKHKACLSKLVWIKRMRGPDISPMGQWTAEYHILEGRSYFGLGQKDKALDRFELALQALRDEVDYSEWEKNYLSAFITSCHSDLDFPADAKLDMDQVDLDYVTNDMKNCFPLKGHPDWLH